MAPCAASREFLQQPRQHDLDADVIVGDVELAGRDLADRAHPEQQSVAGPGLLVDLQDRDVGGGAREPALQPAPRFVTAELVRNGNDQW